MSDTATKVVETISKLSGKPAGEITPESELVADLGIDSPKALQLLIELEETIGIEISDEEAAKMESVGDVLAFYENASRRRPIPSPSKRGSPPI